MWTLSVHRLEDGTRAQCHPFAQLALLVNLHPGLPFAISTWAAHGRSAGNASSHSGTMLTTRHLETPGRWTLAA